MEKIRFGIIGLGNQGSSYMFNIFDAGAVENGVVTAVCDTNPVKLENIKNGTINKEVKYFADYIEMLDSGLCDAILVETPHYQHPEIVMECLKRNINVICEKPAGVYTKQVREMNEAAKKSNAHFAMMFNQRTNCMYRKMREIIQEGGIGEIQRVNWIITDWFRTQQYYESGGWRATWDGEGGGVLINQAIHTIDLLNEFCGGFEELSASCSNLALQGIIEVEDTASICLYNEKAKGTLFATNASAIGLPIGIKLITSDGDLIEIYGDDLKINKQKKEFAPLKVTSAPT